MVIQPKLSKQAKRSGTMLCPICKEQEILVDHHLSGRKIHNAQRRFNRSDICNNCHFKIHSNLIILEGWFMTTDGWKLLWHSADEESITGQSATPHIIQVKNV